MRTLRRKSTSQKIKGFYHSGEFKNERKETWTHHDLIHSFHCVIFLYGYFFMHLVKLSDSIFVFLVKARLNLG